MTVRELVAALEATDPDARVDIETMREEYGDLLLLCVGVGSIEYNPKTCVVILKEE